MTDYKRNEGVLICDHMNVLTRMYQTIICQKRGKDYLMISKRLYHISHKASWELAFAKKRYKAIISWSYFSQSMMYKYTGVICITIFLCRCMWCFSNNLNVNILVSKSLNFISIVYYWYNLVPKWWNILWLLVNWISANNDTNFR